jgi:hypothetical protein
MSEAILAPGRLPRPRLPAAVTRQDAECDSRDPADQASIRGKTEERGRQQCGEENAWTWGIVPMSWNQAVERPARRPT